MDCFLLLVKQFIYKNHDNIERWLYFVYFHHTLQCHEALDSLKLKVGGQHRNTVHRSRLLKPSTTKFWLCSGTAGCGGSQICPCLKQACLDQDWLWLYSGETEQSGFWATGFWLRWRSGCSWPSSPERGQSSAGTGSTSKLSNTWTQPASGPWKKTDPLTTNHLKILLKDRNTALFF